MPRDSRCPSREELERFVLDQLSRDAAGRVRGHLEDCDDCPETISQIESHGDTLLGIPKEDAAEDNPSGGGPLPSHTGNPPTSPAPSDLSADMTPPLAIDVPSSPKTPAREETWDFLAPLEEPGFLGSLGPYRIVSVLGRGGMGVVFKAEDPKLKRHVALKVIRPGFPGHRDAEERFLREAQAVAAINHDNVISIYQIGEAGVPFLEMPLLEGEPLSDRLRRESSLPIRQVLQIGRQIALGLGAAHQRGVIHRDIKPANIWLESGDDRVKLLDFGLARDIDGDSELTATGMVAGTPEYMSPEQANALDVDSRCDLFSFGCVLYRMLTGVSCFAAPTKLSILSALANLDPPPPREINPDVPDDLSTLVLKLLQKNPDDRPQSSQEVVETIDTIEKRLSASDTAVFAGDEQTAVSSKPAIAGSAAGNRGLRAWQRGVGGLAALAAVAIVAVIFILRTSQGTVTIETADDKVRVAIRQGGKLIEIVDADDNWTVRLNAGNYEVELRDTTDQFRLMGNGTIVVTRGDETRLRVVLKQPVAKVEGKAVTVPSPKAVKKPRRPRDLIRMVVGPTRYVQPALAFSPDNKAVVAFEATGNLWRWNIETGQQIDMIPTDPVGGVCAAFTLELKLGVTVVHRQPARLWDLKTRKQFHEFPLQGESSDKLVYAVAISSDGSRVAVVSKGVGVNLISIWDTTNGELVHESLGKHSHNIRWIAFSPDGRSLVCSTTRELQLFDVASGKLLQSRTANGWVHAVKFSPDGKTLIGGGMDKQLHVWDAKTLKPLFNLEGHTGFIWSVAVSSDGRYAVSGSEDKTIRVWDLQKQQEVHKFTAEHFCTLYVAISPDGRYVASGGGNLPPAGTRPQQHDGDNKIYLWRMPSLEGIADRNKPAGLVRKVHGHGKNIKKVAIAPDGKSVVSASYNGFIRRHDFQTGTELAKRHFGAGMASAAFLLKQELAVIGGFRREVAVWNLKRFEKVHRFAITGNQKHVTAVALSADGKLAAASSSANISLWKVETGELIHEHLGARPIGSAFLDFSPDGKSIATGGGVIRVFDIESGKQLKRSSALDAIFSLKHSPDGRTLISGGRDKLLHVWNAETLELIDSLEGHTKPIWSVDVSRDGRFAVSGSSDKTIRVWDLQQRKQVHQFTSPHYSTINVAISPDGRYVISGGGAVPPVGDPRDADYDLYLWEMPPQLRGPESQRPGK